jgi:hypothetical protein
VIILSHPSEREVKRGSLIQLKTGANGACLNVQDVALFLAEQVRSFHELEDKFPHIFGGQVGTLNHPQEGMILIAVTSFCSPFYLYLVSLLFIDLCVLI